MGYDVETHTLTADMYSSLLKKMVLVRSFEEAMQSLYEEGKIYGPLHLCVGQEASSIGSTAALKPQDQIFTTHRGHGECIGKGMDLKAMAAEILGRRYGDLSGVAGSMHLSDGRHGIMGSNGVVGANVPLALGAALTIKKKKIPDKVSVCFFGDGAANQGAVLESMNLAGLWRLPLIFVLIENHYAVSTVPSKASADPDFVKRALPFKLKPFDTDGNDVLKVLYAVSKARAGILKGEGPQLVVEHTYRISKHSRSDNNGYRTEEEINLHKKDDPIDRYRDYLLGEELFTPGEIGSIALNAKKEVDDAVSEAMLLPKSELNAEELEAFVYASPYADSLKGA